MDETADNSTNQSENEKSKKMKIGQTFKPCGPGVGAALYMNENFSDIVLRLTEDDDVWRFPAHSCVLVPQSTVFNTMLGTHSKENNTQYITFQDMSPYILRKFLRYLYLGDTMFENWKEALKLLKVAYRYEVQSLVQECDKYLQEHIDISNVCYICNKASIYNLEELSNICLEVIINTACIVLRSREFEILDKESVISVISSIRLNVDSEMCVINALLRWAIKECCRQNKSLTDGNIYELMIPFEKYLSTASIESDDFHTLPLFMQSVNKTTFNREDFCENMHLLRYAEHIDFKLMTLSCVNYKFSSLDFLRFFVDMPVFLIGFHLTLVTNFDFYYDIFCDMDLLNLCSEAGPVNTCLAEMAFINRPGTSILSDASNDLSEMQVLFDRPILIQPNILYRLSLYRNDDRDPYAGTKFIKFPELGVLNRKGDSQPGSIPFTIHTGTFYGVTKLLYLTVPLCTEGNF